MATSDPIDGEALVCPECGQPVVARPPRRWPQAWGARPRYSHPDGEPLCPVVGRAGYEPARPMSVPPGGRARRIVRRFPEGPAAMVELLRAEVSDADDHHGGTGVVAVFDHAALRCTLFTAPATPPGVHALLAAVTADVVPVAGCDPANDPDGVDAPMAVAVAVVTPRTWWVDAGHRDDDRRCPLGPAAPPVLGALRDTIHPILRRRGAAHVDSLVISHDGCRWRSVHWRTPLCGPAGCHCRT